MVIAVFEVCSLPLLYADWAEDGMYMDRIGLFLEMTKESLGLML